MTGWFTENTVDNNICYQ